MTDNSTLPVEISDIRVLHASHTRRSFLARVFQPVLKPKGGQKYTLLEALEAVTGAAEKLSRFGTSAWSVIHWPTTSDSIQTSSKSLSLPTSTLSNLARHQMPRPRSRSSSRRRRNHGIPSRLAQRLGMQKARRMHLSSCVTSSAAQSPSMHTPVSEHGRGQPTP